MIVEVGAELAQAFADEMAHTLTTAEGRGEAAFYVAVGAAVPQIMVPLKGAKAARRLEKVGKTERIVDGVTPYDKVGLKHPSTPVGHKRDHLTVMDGNNLPTIIENRLYSGHALDKMQKQGIIPSVVENTIKSGEKMSGKSKGTIAYYEKTNDITVIADELTGNIITVSYGFIKQK